MPVPRLRVRCSRLLGISFGALILTFGLAAAGSAAGHGFLTQVPGLGGCVSEDGSGGDCADGKALISARSVAVSPNGKHVYVASRSSKSVAIFRRD